MTIRYLIAADPASTIQPKYDTSILLAQELLKRGIHVDYLDLTETDPTQPPTKYLYDLPVRGIVEVNRQAQQFLRFEPARRTRVTDYAVVLQRKDPPVDDRFRSYSKQFSHTPSSILQINDPMESVRVHEHDLPREFPQFSIPTEKIETFEGFLRTVRKQTNEAVAKPMNESSGVGISFFKPFTLESELQAYYEKWGPHLIVQPYLDEVTRSGDLRVLTFNGEIMGQVMRVPRQGSRLANLHQGASARAHPLTRAQIEASLAISKKLADRKLYLLGIDFIGDLVSEINVTSPSAMVQINAVMNQKTEALVIDRIEALRTKI